MTFGYYITWTPDGGPVHYWTGGMFSPQKSEAVRYNTKLAADRTRGGLAHAMPKIARRMQTDYLTDAQQAA